MQTTNERDLASSRVLIADDREADAQLLDYILETSGFRNTRTTTNPRQVLPLFAEFQPDLVLLDLRMPGLDGLAVMEQLGGAIPAGEYLPIVMVTASAEPQTRQRALVAGAKDFLAKPFDPDEAVLRVRNLLETRLLYRELKHSNEVLEEKVRERTRQLEGAQAEVLERLALAAEYRDDDTRDHTQRVGRMSAWIARALGQRPDEIELIRMAAPLHDVGKIGIPDRISLKSEKYTPQEFEIMKSHTNTGGELLSKSHFPILRLARQIALSHHERWDGTGYPLGLTGERIPMAGRIVAVADVFDALTHGRPHRPAWSFTDAVAEIKRQRGRQFDPRVVDAFLAVVKEHGSALVEKLENEPVAVGVGRI